MLLARAAGRQREIALRVALRRFHWQVLERVAALPCIEAAGLRSLSA